MRDKLDQLKELIAAITTELRDLHETSPAFLAQYIRQVAPELCDAIDPLLVVVLCEQIEESELPDESKIFQLEFEKYNVEYFAGRLPRYITTDRQLMNQALIYEMAYAATGNFYGSAWLREVERVRKMGAPVDPEPDELEFYPDFVSSSRCGLIIIREI